MRRPLCVFCAGMLGVELVCVFLPQTELFVPFAAFFVAFLLLLCIPRRSRKLAVCLLLGALLGAGVGKLLPAPETIGLDAVFPAILLALVVCFGLLVLVSTTMVLSVGVA